MNYSSIDNLCKFDFWEECISTCLYNTTKSEKPIRFLRELERALCKQISDSNNPYTKYLIIVFGSVARLEPANDIDFLIIFEGAPDEHIYKRFSVGEWGVDLNLASPSWLRSAWKDVEWGYWINDAHVIASSDNSLEMIWRNSANSYWSRAGRRRRSADHISMARNLVYAADLVSKKPASLLYRYYIHEAARTIGCGILDRIGNRIYSHRSFLSELTNIGSELLSICLITELICALTGKDRSPERYILIRRHLSDLLRNDCVQSFTGISANLPRKQRIKGLTKLTENDAAHTMELILKERKAEEWLPDAVNIDFLNQAISEIEAHSFLARKNKIFRDVHSISIPYKSDISGARWVELKGNRLKLVVNTGGCRTPSCTFCPLPNYGRKSEKNQIPQILEVALSRYKPQTLALYTDGNYLDPKEISPTDRKEISRILRQYKVKELTIESIPRFVSYENLTEIKDLSYTKLTLAMGFQSYGNSYAVGELGRPDVDVLFDRAIDIAHSVNVSVRLYLMAGLQGNVSAFTDDRLVKTIQWAKDRAVETISICLYRNPLEKSDTKKESLYRNSLIKLVSSIDSLEETRIEILNGSLDSCVCN